MPALDRMFDKLISMQRDQLAKLEERQRRVLSKVRDGVERVEDIVILILRFLFSVVSLVSAVSCRHWRRT